VKRGPSHHPWHPLHPPWHPLHPPWINSKRQAAQDKLHKTSFLCVRCFSQFLILNLCSGMNKTIDSLLNIKNQLVHVVINS